MFSVECAATIRGCGCSNIHTAMRRVPVKNRKYYVIDEGGIIITSSNKLSPDIRPTEKYWLLLASVLVFEIWLVESNIVLAGLSTQQYKIIYQ